jgi:hypothetical protein
MERTIAPTRAGTDPWAPPSNSTMHLTGFVARHPGCVVGRSNWRSPLLWLAVSAATAVACVVLAVNFASSASIVLGLVGVFSGVHAVKRWPPVRETLALAFAGRGCFAIADDEVLLVDPSGRAVLVAIERITELVLAGSEPRLKTDSDAQGVVYATLFALFDEGDLGPSPERFFEALAPRVRARCPRALVSRRDGCDDPLLVG